MFSLSGNLTESSGTGALEIDIFDHGTQFAALTSTAKGTAIDCVRLAVWGGYQPPCDGFIGIVEKPYLIVVSSNGARSGSAEKKW